MPDVLLMDWEDQVLTYLKKDGYTRRDVMIIRSKMVFPKTWAYRETDHAHQLIFRPDLAGMLR